MMYYMYYIIAVFALRSVSTNFCPSDTPHLAPLWKTLIPIQFRSLSLNKIGFDKLLFMEYLTYFRGWNSSLKTSPRGFDKRTYTQTLTRTYT